VGVTYFAGSDAGLPEKFMTKADRAKRWKSFMVALSTAVEL
jgi:hypothetical protein